MKPVVLVPGLWMPGVLMAPLAARLASRGYEARVFAYRGREAYDGNVDALARFARDKTLFVGHSLGGAAFGRWMMGGTCALWEERSARWTRAAPLGVVAGTLPVGLGRAFGALPGANDGVVRVDETTIDGMTERMLVRRGHSMLIFSRRVVGLVDRFPGAGRFQ
jgi:predicted alpha/beta hydrolase